MSQEKTKNKNLIKFIFLGCSNVGKSCIHLRMFEEQYYSSFLHDNQPGKNIRINGHSFDFTIWDLYGCEKYQLVERRYAENAKGAFFIYDILNPRTFKALDKWIANYRALLNDTLIYIIGNKIDEDNKRLITKEQAIQFCNEQKTKYYECSAYTKENIHELIYLFYLDYLNKEEIKKKKIKLNFCPMLEYNNKTDCIIY